ncbi:hypothetical protein WJ971_09850 [Achromobacter xylosoxidans]
MSAPLSLRRYDWGHIQRQLDAEGWAPLPALFSAAQAVAMARAFDDAQAMPSGVDGDTWRSLRPPLPSGLDALQGALRARLAPLADAWARRLGRAAPAATAMAPPCLNRLRQDGFLPCATPRMTPRSRSA